jgi:hypothetical protein
MQTREQIITDMCYTYRHDYGLDKDPNDPSWLSGMTPDERKELYNIMAQLYDDNIKPFIEDLKNGKSS